MKVIPLTKGQFAKVDDEDYERLISLGKWTAGRAKNRYVWYAFRNDGGKTIYMQWVIMGSKGIDHIDLDGLNNQKSNLRLATRSGQQQNKRLQSNNTTGIRGVSWSKSNRKFQVQAVCKGHSKRHWGFYDTKEEASAVAIRVRAKLHGEFFHE